jgi:hypothetical protein
MPHSSEPLIFLKGVEIFLFCGGSPSLGCHIHIKNSRIYSLPVLQLSQHCCKFQTSSFMPPMLIAYYFCTKA